MLRAHSKLMVVEKPKQVERDDKRSSLTTQRHEGGLFRITNLLLETRIISVRMLLVTGNPTLTWVKQ